MTAHSSRAHAVLAPSAAHRWVRCPGSVSLSERMPPEESSVFAAEGTAAHEVAQACLAMGRDAQYYESLTIDTARADFDVSSPNGQTSFGVDGDMVDGVQLYLDTVRNLGTEALWFEHRVATPVEGCWGTADCIAWNSEQKKLTIVDFKYGRFTLVDVERNEQLMLYAAGAARFLKTVGRIKEVELILVQPRMFHPDGPVRRWSCEWSEVETFVAEAAEAARRAGAEDDPSFMAGDHCKYCPAAAICDTLRVEVDQARYDFDVDRAEIGEKLGEALKLAPLAEAWAKSVYKLAEAEARKGRMPKGWKFVAKKAHRKWIDVIEAVHTLVFLGVDTSLMWEPSELRSPAQLEKLLPRKARAVMATLATADTTGVVMAPETDPRPAVEYEAGGGRGAAGFEPIEGVE